MRSIVVLVIGLLCFAGVEATGDTLQMKAAQIAGENDAEGFHWTWFNASYFIIYTSPAVVILAHHFIHESRLNVPFSQNDRVFDIATGCCFAMYGMYVLSPTAAALIHSPAPPADRLLGKSPQWVDAYTKAYQKNMRGHRATSSAAGCILGTMTLVSTLSMILPIVFGHHAE